MARPSERRIPLRRILEDIAGRWYYDDWFSFDIEVDFWKISSRDNSGYVAYYHEILDGKLLEGQLFLVLKGLGFHLEAEVDTGTIQLMPNLRTCQRIFNKVLCASRLEFRTLAGNDMAVLELEERTSVEALSEWLATRAPSPSPYCHYKLFHCGQALSPEAVINKRDSNGVATEDVMRLVAGVSDNTQRTIAKRHHRARCASCIEFRTLAGNDIAVLKIEERMSAKALSDWLAIRVPLPTSPRGYRYKLVHCAQALDPWDDVITKWNSNGAATAEAMCLVALVEKDPTLGF